MVVTQRRWEKGRILVLGPVYKKERTEINQYSWGFNGLVSDFTGLITFTVTQRIIFVKETFNFGDLFVFDFPHLLPLFHKRPNIDTLHYEGENGESNTWLYKTVTLSIVIRDT